MPTSQDLASNGRHETTNQLPNRNKSNGDSNVMVRVAVAALSTTAGLPQWLIVKAVNFVTSELIRDGFVKEAAMELSMAKLNVWNIKPRLRANQQAIQQELFTECMLQILKPAVKMPVSDIQIQLASFFEEACESLVEGDLFQTAGKLRVIVGVAGETRLDDETELVKEISVCLATDAGGSETGQSILALFGNTEVGKELTLKFKQRVKASTSAVQAQAAMDMAIADWNNFQLVSADGRLKLKEMLQGAKTLVQDSSACLESASKLVEAINKKLRMAFDTDLRAAFSLARSLIIFCADEIQWSNKRQQRVF